MCCPKCGESKGRVDMGVSSCPEWFNEEDGGNSKVVSEMRHLRYQIDVAHSLNEHRHPMNVLEELGITYEKAIPQSMGDQWWLLNCQYRELPKYIIEMQCDEWMAKQYNLPAVYINDTKSPAAPRHEVK